MVAARATHVVLFPFCFGTAKKIRWNRRRRSRNALPAEHGPTTSSLTHVSHE
jgi:hypothetical protein